MFKFIKLTNGRVVPGFYEADEAEIAKIAGSKFDFKTLSDGKIAQKIAFVDVDGNKVNLFNNIIDPDAEAFIIAANITDSTQQNAINQLVLDLKFYNLWTKSKVIYPFVGGTASQHKWNLKDPRDLDAAYRLTFTGSFTHSATGVLPDGSTTDADPHFNPLALLTSDDFHISYYSRTDVNLTQVEMGCRGAAGTNDCALEIRTANISYFLGSHPSFPTSFADIDSLGYYLGTNPAANSHRFFKNGSLEKTAATTNSAFNPYDIILFAWNNGGSIGNRTTKECAFATIGDGLTDTDAANMYTAIQEYQTTLGRQV